MSKYITHFQTEAAYQAALPTLDLPNVSLVDELGEVHYHRALYGAHAGDIALYDVAEGQKIVVTAEDWNLTDYPTASYPIIGVVVVDETAAGCKVMSNFFVGADGTPSTTDTSYQWANSAFEWEGVGHVSTYQQAEVDMNGKVKTTNIINFLKSYDLSHGSDNITGRVGGVIQKYAPTGTVAGDWYIPASGELYSLYTNKTTLLASFNKINNASSSAGLSGSVLFGGECLSSTQRSRDYIWYYNISTGNSSEMYKSSGGKLRAFTFI